VFLNAARASPRSWIQYGPLPAYAQGIAILERIPAARKTVIYR
jgi:hypothetical protein